VECQDQLREEQDLRTSYLRLRALPLNGELADFLERHERIYVVEQNRDAQMLQLLRIELASRPDLLGKLRSVLHYSGLPIDARFVTNQIVSQERGG
jgi:2-oxoglutarate ferredoxin oxidoreductase subunit alpha